MMAAREPDKYLEAHIRDALATDDRTNLCDSQVTIAAGKVFLLGTVESEERRAAAEAVVREVTPEGMEIVNEMYVEANEAPPTVAERI